MMRVGVRSVCLAYAALLWAPLCAAEQVACHYAYGGEERLLLAAPTADPYAVGSIEVGSYFRFRVVFRSAPADLATIKTYVYADRDDGVAPIHQGNWPYPPPPGGRYGFTGMHSVYEPMRDGELQYWCELRGGT